MHRKQQQQLSEINLQLKCNNNRYTIPKKSQYFPMKSSECFDKFDKCSDEEYQNTVSSTLKHLSLTILQFRLKFDYITFLFSITQDFIYRFRILFSSVDLIQKNVSLL